MEATLTIVKGEPLLSGPSGLVPPACLRTYFPSDLPLVVGPTGSQCCKPQLVTSRPGWAIEKGRALNISHLVEVDGGSGSRGGASSILATLEMYIWRQL